MDDAVRSDPLTPAQRSAHMSRVRSKDTGPELRVRRMVRRLGFHYRLHGKGLPGRPDLVFRGRRKVIFVHGCFWHGHLDCGGRRIPRTRSDYWEAKLLATRARDERVRAHLLDAGWSVLVLWECELVDEAALSQRLVAFLT